MVDQELLLLFTPGICSAPLKKISVKELAGWRKENGVGTQEPTVLLSQIFTGLKNKPLIVLKDKKFDPYKPDACGNDVPAKYKKYYNKWFLYSGDYLSDTNAYCLDATGLPTEKTLIFFDADGDNHYFGLKKSKAGWILQWVASNSECAA